MTDTWVVNASPVISLARIGRLDLLQSLGGQLLLPEQVAAEVLAGPPDDPAASAVAAGWGQRCRPKTTPVSILEWGLGAGESSVLAVCLEQRASGVLDDAAARKAARTLSVPFIGTLGVVIRAKRLGFLNAAAPIISDLRKAGLFLDDAIVAELLRSAGEPSR